MDKKPEELLKPKTNLTPTEITDEQYHKLADDHLEAILNKFEELQDARDDVDVEYSVGPIHNIDPTHVPPGSAILT
jgi:frataxin